MNKTILTRWRALVGCIWVAGVCFQAGGKEGSKVVR
jgi:hypothetical protein